MLSNRYHDVDNDFCWEMFFLQSNLFFNIIYFFEIKKQTEYQY